MPEVPVHEHAHPCNPPDGTMSHPGPCTVCGMTYKGVHALLTLRSIADGVIGPAGFSLLADELSAYADRLEEAMRGEHPRQMTTETEYGLAYGGEDPNDCAGLLGVCVESFYAQEMTRWVRDSRVAVRTVMSTPWRWYTPPPLDESCPF